MAVAPQRIHDYASFQEVAKEPNQIAGLYFFSSLDCLATLATRVAHDFFERPHLYTEFDEGAIDPDLHGSLSSVLAALHAREGSNERFLDAAQRRTIYAAVFGPGLGWAPDPQGDFARLRQELVNACAAFAERVFDTGVEMLRERVRTSHRPLKEYLTGVHGASVRWSTEEGLAGLTEAIAYRILRNRGVASVFGVARPTTDAWPYDEDSNGDKLVEAIARQLMPAFIDSNGVAPGEPYPMPAYTRERFSNLQRVGRTGAVALRTVLDFDDAGSTADMDRLITACYTWGSALLSLKVEPAPPGAAPAPAPAPASVDESQVPSEGDGTVAPVGPLTGTTLPAEAGVLGR